MNQGDTSEPGSGERLAIRQIAAGLAFEAPRRVKVYSDKTSELISRLRGAIADAMARAVTVESSGVTRIVPKGLSDRSVNPGSMVSRVGDLGERLSLDIGALERLFNAAEEIERLRDELEKEVSEVGGIQCHLIVAGSTLGQWMASFPVSPFSDSFKLEVDGRGSTLAREAVREKLALCAQKVGQVRQWEQNLAGAPPTVVSESGSEALGWLDLTADELALCPPVVLICGQDVLSATGIEELNQLLSTGLPVKIVLLDTAATFGGRGELASGSDPGLAALAHRGALVASCSIAYPDHLFAALRHALRFRGPALIQIYTPIPSDHGYQANETIDRARIAVQSRVRPLLRFDPLAETEPGQGLSIQGNPAPEQPWVIDPTGSALTPAHWAAGETRFAAHFSALAESAEPVAIEAWTFLPSTEQSTKTPTIRDRSGAARAVGTDLAEATIGYAEIWANLQKIVGIAPR